MSINIKASVLLALFCGYSLMVTAKEGVSERVSLLVSQGKYEQVLTELNQLDDADKTLETAKFRALALLKLGQYDQAELSYLGIQEQDDGVDVSNNLGLIYLRQSRLSEAIRTFQRNISRFPSDPVAYKNLGDVYLILAKLTYKKGSVAADNGKNLGERAAEITALMSGASGPRDQEKVSPLDQPIQERSLAVESEQLRNPDLLTTPLLEVEVVQEEAAETIESSVQAASPDDPANVNFSRGREPEIDAFLKSWAAALSSKEVDAYLNHYVVGTDAYDAAKSRSSSLSGEINANPDEPSVTFVSDNLVSVVFDEWTGPRGSRSRVFKEFKLSSISEGWKITEEKTLFSYN